jgi:methylenetetrahydrofolate dehydrogenase (NADP+)/methenyltetrahydrofolate cyclohydrolase
MSSSPSAAIAETLDGKKVAEAIYRSVPLEISLLAYIPKLVVILVGEDPASQTYVRSKGKKCQDLGLRSETVNFPASVTEQELVDKIRALNRDREVNGILVQLPLPVHIHKHRVLEEIDPNKDVDGLHSQNLGRLMQGEPRFVPCTPAGVIEILKFYNIPIAGQRAVVVGRSEIVGRPMAQLLVMKDATVTLCHSKTRQLEEETSRADILIVAMGRPKFIGASHVKAGAAVIDVGIHRVGDKLCGDVDFEAVSAKAAFLTPVPGGVGPMTIAMLMKNLCTAAALQTRLKT